MMFFVERDIAIDLGTDTTLLYVSGKGIRLREPTIVAVDRQTGYRTRSLLTVPLLNSRSEVIGAYQCINRLTEPTSGTVVFDGGESSRKVLADLAAFCGADEDGFIADNERANAYMQGRLSVYLHIKQQTNKRTNQ